jgi:protein gp37
MGEHTTISWCDRTFNPWIGCTKVSVGERGACESCYAEVATPTRAMHVTWGSGKPRHRTSESTWALPLRWERGAEAFQAMHGRRQRVFCASLADVLDNEIDPQWRVDLFNLIRSTPSLDWLLLTKRIGNAAKMLPTDWANGYANVWLGATVANQKEAERDIPKLLATPAHLRFLSCEPLLGPLNLRNLCIGTGSALHTAWGIPAEHDHFDALHAANRTRLDWVITGSESGRKARPCDLTWVRTLRDQCIAAGVAFHWKQHVTDGIKHHTPELDGKRWVEFPH